jgi:hypothetical protein
MSPSTRGARLLGAVAAVLAVVLVPSTPAGATKSFKYTVVVTDEFLPGGGIEFHVDVIPPEVVAGLYKIEMVNQSVAPHVIVGIGGLPAGTSTEDFIALIEAVDGGAAPPEGVFETGAVFADSGKRHQAVSDLTAPGTYGYFCPILSPDGTPHFREGFVGVFEVVAP